MAELALERLPADHHRAREGIATLKNEIEFGREAIRKLTTQRACHFGNLPVEIATTIFSMILEEDHLLVLTLAQVCKNWRATVIGTPAFWRTLVLGARRPKQKVKLWRKRAGDRFHELALLDSFTDHYSALAELRDVPLETLRMFRCEGHPLEPLLASIPNLSAGVLASLDTLVLQPPSPEGFPLCAPETLEIRWRMLRLLNSLPSNLLSIAKRLTRLTSLSLEKCPVHSRWAELLLLLHHNPALVRLEMSDLDSPPPPSPLIDDDGPPLIIALPELHFIKITNTKSLANRLLPRFATPSLKMLHIASHPERLDECMSWLACGPAATLTTLSLQRLSVKAALLLEVLKAAKALESLQITHLSGVALPVLELLATPIGEKKPYRQGDKASPVHCPALQHLDLSHCPDVGASLLIALVKLRHPETQTALSDVVRTNDESGTTPTLVRPLESLIIDGCPNVDADVLPWLRAAVPSLSCVYLAKQNAKWRR
ncbi:hypothetical protein BN946_scf185007.g37 [Trametes cinnabarina]|uniref:F-box domain-containing protein n=1 Tax=Pycnoporus cinnabarinus TaxID=5643 RepID=A0A060SKN1_PYCCI|nr:hypothetical protein BN946_scf185007.g37 [Trametes cinnabarina]